MEVLHVIGQESFEKERNIVTSPLNSMEGILGHTTRVFHQNFLTIYYHAVCDFDFMRIKHRVPIRGLRIRRKEEERRKDVKVDMELLERYPVLEEEEAVSVEMRHLWNEMKAIDLDRRGIAAKKKCNDTSLAVECDTRWNVCSIPNCDKHWDINIHLDSVDKRKPGSQNDSIHVGKSLKKFLQKRRGAYLHAGFPVRSDCENDKDVNVLKSFAMRCGGNPNSCEPHKTLSECASFMGLFGLHCVSTSSANARHLAIMTDDDASPTFFMSKDDGRFYCDGTLPSRLLKRLEEEQEHELNTNNLIPSIRYLSLGPNDSYFVELISGRCFWGIGRYDEEFDNAVDEMDVHRVAFGSFEMDSSWIVISKEGQISWRNIPPRLHRLLQQRQKNQAAASEISLGAEGTYFIKFLDGEIDYCLSCFADEMARGILSQGADITNIILNPDVPNAFIIRHTELPK